MLRTGRFVSIMAVAGLLFLYIPILLMMVLSFNASRLVSVWGGFSLKWYGELFANDQLLGAAWLSVKVAGVSATLTVVLGTLAGYVLTRFGPFRGRAMMAGMVTAPLVMPEVITGLSLLLLFVAMEDFIGWPQGRSPTTIIIAHATFCMAYVTIIVQSRRRISARGHGGRSSTSPCRCWRRRWCRAGCWPSRCPSTTWSSQASSPGRGRAPCRW